MKRWMFMWLLLLTGRVALADEPHLQFVFPAGGCQGDTFQVEVGGQFLEGATNVYLSGEGVEVTIDRFAIRYEPRRLGQLIRNRANRMATLEGKEGKERQKIEKQIAQIEKQIALADLPDDIDPYNKKDMNQLRREAKKEQFNPQLSHRLFLTVSISEEAVPGERALRVGTAAGLSNPIFFEVETLQEMREQEPNDDHMSPALQEVTLPAIINGQIRPGDIDHFRFEAPKGASIVVDVRARRIIPYLADAVPGWFQAVVALYDEDGTEVAYQDDYKFNPDPVLLFDVPEAGFYTLSIRDSIYRGREDFIYRIALGELPFIEALFPLGGQRQQNVHIDLRGKNLPKQSLTGHIEDSDEAIRYISMRKEGFRSNQLPFAIGREPEGMEQEPNNSVESAQPVTRPFVVNGRIQEPSDVDVYSFHGSKGDHISIEVMARRLGSPLDSVITLRGKGLDTPVRNDDYVRKGAAHLYLGAGLVTHHADSYLLHVLPADGIYTVEIGDAQLKGGHDYAYRLKMASAAPDFALRMEPSGIQMAPGGTAAFNVHAERRDGFEGPIVLKGQQLPKGFVMSDATIAEGSDFAQFTITAPWQVGEQRIAPEIIGRAVINGHSVVRPALPADDQMQAFLYRHLVPAEELVLTQAPKRPPIYLEAVLPKSGRVELPVGGHVVLKMKGSMAGNLKKCVLRLDHPPSGIVGEAGWIGLPKDKKSSSEKSYKKVPVNGSIQLHADDSLQPGAKFNLVVVAEVRRGKNVSYYHAPAIPVKIVKAH